MAKGDIAAVKRLVNSGNVQLPVRYPQMQGTPPLPIVAEVEPNTDLATAQPLALGVAVHGTLTEEDVDHFSLSAPTRRRAKASP